MTDKPCFICKEILPLTSFYKHSEMSGGRLNKCKECTKKDVRENYRKNIDHYKDYEKERFKTPKRKKFILAQQKKYRALNPDKYKARNAVNNAIRDKRLKRMPCSVCGDTKSEAHHEDYSEPLDVNWLCFKHHRELHGQEVT